MPPKATYPDMKPEEIASTLADWGVAITAEQLLRPTSDLVESIYWACLTEVTGISRERLQQPIQQGLQACTGGQREEDKHSYIPALDLTYLLFHLGRLTSAAGLGGCSVTDIVNPKPSGTITFLSAIINFVKFTDQECEPFVRELQNRSEDMLIERNQITQELAIIKDKITVMKARIAEDEPKCDQMRQESMVLRSKILAAKDQQTSGLEVLERLKSEKTALVKRREILNNELDNSHNAIMHTRSRIVQSPERLKRNITSMGATANDDKRTIAIHEAKARDLQAKINALHNISRDVRGCIEQLQTIEKESDALHTSQNELSVLRDHLEERKIAQNELQLRRDRVRKQLANAHEKLERAQRHLEEKRAANQRTSERLQQDYNEMVNERRGNEEQIEKLQQEADAIEAEKNEQLEANSRELSELLDEYWKLRHSIDVYMETLSNGLPK